MPAYVRSHSTQSWFRVSLARRVGDVVAVRLFGVRPKSGLARVGEIS